MNRNRLKIGLEIECVYNDNEVLFNRGSYHAGIKKGKYWSIETDGSLNSYGSDFDNSKTAEFVSKVFCSKKLFIKGLEEFKGFFDNKELKDVLFFNSSCGCHFHIGLNGSKKYTDFLSFEELKKIRNKFFKDINKSVVLSDDTKRNILKQYFRSYAKKINKDICLNGWSNNRTLEFNKLSEDSNKGLEWRSLNLCSVKTWEEFFEVMNIIFNCVEKLFRMRTNGFSYKEKKVLLIKKELNNLNLNVDSLLKNIPGGVGYV
jgi:hypothetical protein